MMPVPRMKERDEAIDFLKCVFIILMVAFHLAWFADRHLVLKSFVYTFHMPGFLLLSGWLASLRGKRAGAFLRRMGWTFVPYAVMESAYVVAASFLPVREEAGELTPLSLLLRLVWNPMGPYWYLHTWMLCQCICYMTLRLLPRVSVAGRVAVASCAVYGLSLVCPVFGLANGLYFLAGWALRESGVSLRRAFPPTAWLLLPFLLLAMSPQVFDRATVGGVALVCCVMSLLFRLHAVPAVGRSRVCAFIGRNTLPILLFSPVFTMAAKALLPWLSADGSGVLFMLVGTVLGVGGSLGVARACDALRLSRWMAGGNLIKS